MHAATFFPEVREHEDDKDEARSSVTLLTNEFQVSNRGTAFLQSFVRTNTDGRPRYSKEDHEKRALNHLVRFEWVLGPERSSETARQHRGPAVPGGRLGLWDGVFLVPAVAAVPDETGPVVSATSVTGRQSAVHRTGWGPRVPRG